MTPRPPSTNELTRDECATLVGIEASTWSSYVARGQAPAPVRHVVRTPLWSRRKVEAWKAARPGQGVGGGRKAAEDVNA